MKKEIPILYLLFSVFLVHIVFLFARISLHFLQTTVMYSRKYVSLIFLWNTKSIIKLYIKCNDLREVFKIEFNLSDVIITI